MEAKPLVIGERILSSDLPMRMVAARRRAVLVRDTGERLNSQAPAESVGELAVTLEPGPYVSYSRKVNIGGMRMLEVIGLVELVEPLSEEEAEMIMRPKKENDEAWKEHCRQAAERL